MILFIGFKFGRMVCICLMRRNEMYSTIHKYKMSQDLKLGKTCS